MTHNWLSSTRIQYLVFAGAVIAGCVFRLDGLGRELGHDEAYSWVKFASRSYEYIATTYFIPNNHIFHSVLMRLAVQLFGKAEWTIRLVALLAGVMAIPAVFLLCRELTGQARVGLAASWILACMPVHISYSQVARGYTLLVLLALVAWAVRFPSPEWPRIFLVAGLRRRRGTRCVHDSERGIPPGNAHGLGGHSATGPQGQGSANSLRDSERRRDRTATRRLRSAQRGAFTSRIRMGCVPARGSVSAVDSHAGRGAQDRGRGGPPAC